MTCSPPAAPPGIRPRRRSAAGTGWWPSRCCKPTRGAISPSYARVVDRVHVIGASGRTGAALCRALRGAGVDIVPVIRDPAKWASLGNGPVRVADLGDHAALTAALHGARHVVSCAHARHAPSVLAAAPADASYVFLGSTRKFTRWPDAHGRGVQAGEAAFLASGRAGVMLHPTMIYGAEGDDNVQRLAALLRRLPIVPLPGGGRALVQPIHQDDLTSCIRAALARDWSGPETLVVAGPEPVAYAEFVREVAAAAGLARPRLVPLPAWLLIAAALPTALLPVVPTIRPAEIRRLLEDKAFDIGPMVATLGVQPIPLQDGLARTFAPQHKG
ncbi:MAG: NAD(P)H-binding protein [Rhodospirillales bacterium]|nr:NAD(P)H-binding protein [Rhodospirillales bacterium]